MTFTAQGLPAGLALDPESGIIIGRVAKAGTYRARLLASNAHGQAAASFASSSASSWR